MYRGRIPGDDKKQVGPTGGLGGLSHVDKKNPAPRPAPRELLNGSGPPPSARTPPSINLSNSPYANENNSPPNFQTPTFGKMPAPNPAPEITKLASAPLGKTNGKKLFTWKNALYLGALTTTVFVGYKYTNRQSVKDYKAELMEDDD